MDVSFVTLIINFRKIGSEKIFLEYPTSLTISNNCSLSRFSRLEPAEALTSTIYDVYSKTTDENAKYETEV